MIRPPFSDRALECAARLRRSLSPHTHHTMAGMLRTFSRRAFAAAAAPAARQGAAYTGLRAMATGPAAGGHINDELLEKLGSLSTQALIDGLWVMGWPTSHIMGARPLTEGQPKLVGRAITIQFAPTRPDIARDKPGGMESPEYEVGSFPRCKPKLFPACCFVGWLWQHSSCLVAAPGSLALCRQSAVGVRVARIDRALDDVRRALFRGIRIG